MGDNKFWNLGWVALEAEHRGSLQKPPWRRRDALGRVAVLRQGAPTSDQLELYPGSIPLEDPQAGALGEYIPMLGGGEREGRNLSASEVCHWNMKERGGGDLTGRA